MDVKKAFYFFKLAADKNHSQAQFNVGLFYYEGKAVEKNISESIKYYELSAKQNNIEALVCLGNLYRKGEVVTKDCIKVKEYFELASEINSAEAQDCLGNMYNNGDCLKAKDLFKKSSKLGNARGSYLLANLYFNGYDEIPQNIMKAVKYYEKASKRNYVPVICMLGDIYYWRLGFDINYSKAIEYYSLALEYRNNKVSFQIGIII